MPRRNKPIYITEPQTSLDRSNLMGWTHRQQKKWKAGTKYHTAHRGLNKNLYMTGEIPTPLFSLDGHYSAHKIPGRKMKDFFTEN